MCMCMCMLCDAIIRQRERQRRREEEELSLFGHFCCALSRLIAQVKKGCGAYCTLCCFPLFCPVLCYRVMCHHVLAHVVMLWHAFAPACFCPKTPFTVYFRIKYTIKNVCHALSQTFSPQSRFLHETKTTQPFPGPVKRILFGFQPLENSDIS